jgi:hypothetical protein
MKHIFKSTKGAFISILFTIGFYSTHHAQTFTKSGTVYEDYNGNRTANAGEPGTNAGSQLYAYLIGATPDTVIQVQAVASNGTFSFTVSAMSGGYNVGIAKSGIAVGTYVGANNAAYNATLIFPDTWESVTPTTNHFLGAGNGTNSTALNFFIRKEPTAADTFSQYICNSNDTSCVSIPALNGTAATGNSAYNITNYAIYTIPANGVLKRGTTAISAGDVITAAQASTLCFDPTAGSSGYVTFKYAAIDVENGDNYYSDTATYTIKIGGLKFRRDRPSSYLPVCKGQNAMLSTIFSNDTSGLGITYSYNWSGPNSYSSTLANPTMTANSLTDSGRYIIAVTDQYGCVSKDTIMPRLMTCFKACDYYGYLIKGSGSTNAETLYKVDLSTGANTAVASNLTSVDAVTFNSNNNLIYAISEGNTTSQHFFVVDAVGKQIDLGLSGDASTLLTQYYVGTTAASTSEWLLGMDNVSSLDVVDINPTSSTYMRYKRSISLGSGLVPYDLGWNASDSMLYGFYNNQLYKINPNTGAQTIYNTTVNEGTANYGAVFMDVNSNLWVSNSSSGKVYKGSLKTAPSGTVTFTFMANGPSAQWNDGTAMPAYPTMTIDATPQTVCNKDTLKLTVASFSGYKGGYTFSWSGPSSYSATTTSQVINLANAATSQSGQYIVTLNDSASGCAITKDTINNTVNLCYVNLSGTVWDDANGSASGAFTSIQNGAEAGTQGGVLYANLVDSASGLVLVTATVGSNGTYSFTRTPVSTNVSLQLSKTQGTVGQAPPSVTLNTNWVNTSPLTRSITIGTVDLANYDFGIEQLPTSSDKTASSQVNPGGAVKVQSPGLGGTDAEDGTLGQGKTFIIKSLPTNATLYYNNVAVTVNQSISSFDSTLLRVDPSFNGNGTVTFTYAAVDAASQQDASPNTVTMPFTSLSIGGNVYNDANGLTDNIVNGTAVGNPASTPLYANLIDSATNLVVSKTAINTVSGAYSFTDSVNANTNYKLIISTTQGTIGGAAPTAILPTNWGYVGETYGSNNTAGTGNESSTPNGIVSVKTSTANIAGVNIGIEQIPTSNDKTASSQLNPGGTNKVLVPALSGNDPEDGYLGASKSFTIKTLPTNADLYYNNVLVTLNQTITNFDSTLLKVDPTFNGLGTVTFTYAALDAALQKSSNIATVTMPFTSLSITGTIYSDANGLTDFIINGTAMGNPSGTTIYAYLTDSATKKVIQRVTVNPATGTYTFTDSISSNNAYEIVISSTLASLGGTRPSVTLPSGWGAVGDGFGSNNQSGTGYENNTNNGITLVRTSITNITAVNFAIEQAPVSDPKSYVLGSTNGNILYNTNKQLLVSTGLGTLTGSDPEDGNLLTGRKVVISDTTGLNGSKLYYDLNGNGILEAGELLGPASEISNYDSNKLYIRFVGLGSTGLSFTYAFKDSAGLSSAAPANYSISWVVPLPVNLLYFNATEELGSVSLAWASAMEKSLSHYVIERLNRHNVWLPISQTAGLNQAQVTHYTTIDGHPMAGLNHYRLTPINLDGSPNEALITSVNMGDKESINIYPNPSNGLVSITSAKKDIAQLVIYDDHGKWIMQIAAKGQATVDMGYLPKGLYIVIVLAEDGQMLAQKRLVLN